MPIPAFGPEGLLPPGVHDCTLESGSGNLAEAVLFFTQVRQRPDLKKGLLRLTL